MKLKLAAAGPEFDVEGWLRVKIGLERGQRSSWCLERICSLINGTCLCPVKNREYCSNIYYRHANSASGSPFQFHHTHWLQNQCGIVKNLIIYIWKWLFATCLGHRKNCLPSTLVWYLQQRQGEEKERKKERKKKNNTRKRCPCFRTTRQCAWVCSAEPCEAGWILRIA